MTGPTFIVSGIEPFDLAIEPDVVKLWYWGQVVALVLKAKDDELSKGLDRFGNRMASISERTRKHRRSAMGPADPDAPPLTPAYGLSRTRSLFTGLPRLEYAEFGWNYDVHTGASWGDILWYHAQGEGRLPVRDVLGLSPNSLAWVKREASKRWMDFRRARNAGQALEPATPKPATAFEPLGITDLRDFTFGIGGTKEEVQRAIDAGLSTGFRQLHAMRPPPGPLRPGVTVPVPPPKPPPRPAVAKAIAARAKKASETPTAPPAEPVKPVQPAAAALPLTLESFATRALRAARSVPLAERYSESKVWIIDAYYSFSADHPEIGYEEYKRRLLEAHRNGLLVLSRFDLPGQLSPEGRAKDASSALREGIAEFNQIRI